MDEGSAITGYVALGVSVIASIIGVINHTKVRSMCCGRKLEISLDISKTSVESPSGLRISIPPRVEINMDKVEV